MPFDESRPWPDGFRGFVAYCGRFGDFAFDLTRSYGQPSPVVTGHSRPSSFQAMIDDSASRQDIGGPIIHALQRLTLAWHPIGEGEAPAEPSDHAARREPRPPE